MKKLNTEDVANEPIEFRREIRPEDSAAVASILSETGVFTEDEVSVAQGLIDLALAEGVEKSGYYFTFIEVDQKIRAYACYGPIPITEESWDFYWLATLPEDQKKGYASLLMDAVCEDVVSKGGRYLFAEVSSLPQSEKIRRFHMRHGLECLATIPDFFKQGDDKIIYRKVLR